MAFRTRALLGASMLLAAVLAAACDDTKTDVKPGASFISGCPSASTPVDCLVTGLGAAKTSQDLYPLLDPAFLEAGETKAGALREDLARVNAATTVPLTVGTPVSGTATATSGPAYLVFSLAAAQKVAVSFTANSANNVDMKLYDRTSGARYLDGHSFHQDPATGTRSYVATLPAAKYVFELGMSCGLTCPYTAEVQLSTAAEDYIFPGIVPGSTRTLLVAGTTNRYYFGFKFVLDGKTVSSYTMGMPPARNNLLYGNQRQHKFTAQVFSFTDSTATSSVPTTVGNFFINLDQVAGVGVTAASLAVSAGLTIQSGGTSASTAQLTLSGTCSATERCQYFLPGSVVATSAGVYPGGATLTVTTTGPAGTQSQTVTLPATQPAMGTVTFTASGGTGTHSWAGWDASGLTDMQAWLNTSGSPGGSAWNFSADPAASGTLSVTLSAPNSVSFAFGSSYFMSRVAESLVTVVGKSYTWSSGGPNPLTF